MPSVINEHTQFFDDVTGELIVNGSAYIGARNLDPVANTITIYSDRALTTPLANPQTTDANGRTVNKIWVPSKYSIRVNDSAGVQKYLELDNGDPSDGKLLVSSDDTTPNYIDSKLLVGDKLTKTTNNAGANETITLSVSENILETIIGRESPAGTSISISEAVMAGSAITLVIPTGWNTYDIDVICTAYLSEAGATGDTVIDIRVKEGTTTAGTEIGRMRTTIAAASPDNDGPIVLYGYSEGKTATGNISHVLTTVADANSSTITASLVKWSVKATRTS